MPAAQIFRKQGPVCDLGLKPGQGVRRGPNVRTSAPQPRVAILEVKHVMEMLTSAAKIFVMQGNLQINWKRDVQWLPDTFSPGHLEVEILQGEAFQKEVNSRTEVLFDAFIEKMGRSPAEGFSYLEKIEQQKRAAAENLQRTFADIQAANNSAAKLYLNWMKVFATIKAACDLGVLFLSKATGPLGERVSNVYDITGIAVTDVIEGKSVDAVILDFTGLGAEYDITNRLEKVAKHAKGKIGKNSVQIFGAALILSDWSEVMLEN